MLSRVDIRPTEIDFSNINPLTHRNLTKGKEQVTHTIDMSPHLASNPSLPSQREGTSNSGY